MVRHEQRLAISLETVPFQTVRIRRRVITETVMVPVQIRREVLDIQATDLPVDSPQLAGGATVDVSDPVPQFVIELHEEVPVVDVRVQLTERIHVGVRTVVTDTLVRDSVSAEHVVVETAGLRHG